jgi:hypothetical protein
MTRQTTILALVFALLGGCAVDTTVPGTGPSGLDGKADIIADDPGSEAPPSRVELKVTIDPDQIEDAIEALELDEDDAERRYITYYDTEDLDFFEAGLVLRSRKIIDDDDDSSVKMRPMTADEAWGLIPDYFEEDGFKCEIDRTPSRETSSCSLKAKQHRGEIDDVADGERDLDKLFSSEQENLVDLFAPEGFDWDDLEILGPVDTQRWEWDVEALGGEELTVELWQMPDGGTLMELSIKVEQEESVDAMQALLAYVADHGLSLDDAQTTKTRRVLTHFAGGTDR